MIKHVERVARVGRRALPPGMGTAPLARAATATAATATAAAATAATAAVATAAAAAAAAALAGAVVAGIVLLPATAAPAPPPLPPPGQSPGGAPHAVHALVGARIVPRPGETIASGTVVIRDGLIEAAGPGVEPPPDARVWDLRGMTVYAGLIEPYLRLDGEPGEQEEKNGDASAGAAQQQQPAAPAGATHANPQVHPERAMADAVALDGETLEALRAAGFTAALLVPASGVLRGTSAFVDLRDGSPREQVLRAGVAQHAAFEHGSWDGNAYPTSLMGAIALIRQTLLDTQHAEAARAAYAREPRGLERPETNRSLAALAPVVGGRQPLAIEVEDAQMLLRAAALGGEFGLHPWLVAGGSDAYRWFDAVRAAAAGSELVLGVNFPPPPRWEDDDEAVMVELDALRRWQLAPADPRRLHEAGLRFSLTAQGLEKRSLFRARVREAIERGLPAEVALAACTTTPAALCGVEAQLGTIEPGKIANLTVADGDLFAAETEITEVWVDGRRYDVDWKVARERDAAGTWRLELGPAAAVAPPAAAARVLTLEVRQRRGALSGRVWAGEPADSAASGATPLAKIDVWRGKLRAELPAAAAGGDTTAGPLQVTALIDGRLLRGRWTADGAGGELRGRRIARRSGDEEEADEETDASEGAGDNWQGGGSVAAAGSLGVEAAEQLAGRALAWPPLPEPAPRAVLVRNATIWTLAADGILAHADLLCRDGKIVATGTDLAAPAGALIIDAAGRHVTPGIIDCHSHAFVSGPVNECTHSCTAEVRIGDVVDAETMNLYHQLAGGVTASHVLHGSCNAIGGQNAIIKLRWGEPPDGLLLEGAPPTIKFALGENPKRSNWDNPPYQRFPTSRMGVEQSIRERLIAARAYLREQEVWRRSPHGIPPRRDLQLEALAEVLRGERFVHSHAYRQDEILMLIRVAEEFGFTVAAFQHVLEGYKVADEMAAHGAGGSCFSDWWAYKFEVYDAIPYNGAIMWKRGVVVSFNSDSGELARRLNREAAKAVRYGGVPEVEAFKFVSLNAARQLHLDDRLGSLEPGKDADFVIWSDHPFAPAAVCDETWIDGRRYFSRERDAGAREQMETVRARLLALARQARDDEEQKSKRGWKPTFGARYGLSAEQAGLELVQGDCATYRAAAGGGSAAAAGSGSAAAGRAALESGKE